MRKISQAIFFITIAFSSLLSAKHYGFKELGADDRNHIEHHIHKVIEVKANEIGAARIRELLQSDEFSAADPSEEFTTAQLSSSTALRMLASGATLPSAVNNSLLNSFPPIGDQQELGSCVAWGSTYYQATHELGLLNGVNNKSSSSSGILSPKWTYNLLNGGQDDGLVPTAAYQLLAVNGAANLASFPYDTNYTAWDLNINDWVAAISNRMAPMTAIPGLGGSSAQNLTAIKQALNNGHVLTFATYIDSWVFTQIKSDPQNINNLHVGEYAGYWMNGTNGGHFITIVGYDDTLWIDVNQNNSVDAGERGAFLVANSWGSSWGNEGFIWISYDAFLSTSAVVNGPSRGRVAAGTPLNSLVISAVPKAANYSPQLIGEFSLAQTQRNQLSVQIGASSTTQNSPVSQIAIPALTNQGGTYEFNGVKSNTAEMATFAVDLTDLLPSGDAPETQRYYLICADNASGNPTTLSGFSLIDPLHSRTLGAANLPVTFDHSSTTSHIDYNLANPSPTPPTVSITSPANNSTVSGTVQFTVNATSGGTIANVQLASGSTALGTDTSAPYLFSVNTNSLSNGSHIFTATATDTLTQSAQATVTLTVANRPSIYVNAGGPTLVYGGTTWVNDARYISGSSTTSSVALPSGNPVYQTDRAGSVTYTFSSIPNGSYAVTLMFMENQFAVPRKRIFNASLNGTTVLSNVDLYSLAGKHVAYNRTFSVTVTNQRITLSLIPVANTPIINAIQITPQ